MPEAAGAAYPLKLDISVRLIEPRDNLLGFANVTINDSIRIDDFKIVNGEKGLFVGMPSKAVSKGGETKYYDTVRPTTKEFRAELNEAVATAYYAEVEKLQARAAAVTSPSIPKQLADAKEQAAKENAARSAPAKSGKAAER